MATMQVVAVRNSITVPSEKGHNTITLHVGVGYVMHDTEVASGIAAGVCGEAAGLTFLHS